ncbi:MAG: hypothetical protein QNJ97_02405 [Myxococcota bacterium]|nr:hypothetical protein [Myxococcota bacterium]
MSKRIIGAISAIFFVLISMALGAKLFGSQNDRPDEKIKMEMAPTRNNNISPIKTIQYQLTSGNISDDELHDLKRRIEALENRENQIDTSLEDVPIEIEEEEKDPSARYDAILKTELARVEQFNESFESEERDEKWATGMEDAIETEFDDGDYQGSQIFGPECKTTFCRVEAMHESEDAKLEFERIGGVLPGHFYFQFLGNNEDGSINSVAYFIRKETADQNIINNFFSGRELTE